jgi:hypothetical protein
MATFPRVQVTRPLILFKYFISDQISRNGFEYFLRHLEATSCTVQDTQSTGFHRIFLPSSEIDGYLGSATATVRRLAAVAGTGRSWILCLGPWVGGENRVSDMKYWPGFPIIFFCFVTKCYIYCNYHWFTHWILNLKIPLF